TRACVRPDGMNHLENPALTSDLTMARNFDLGISGPPMSISMDFIAGGLVEMVGGVASAIVLAGYSWWAPVLLAGAWLAAHCVLVAGSRRGRRHSLTWTAGDLCQRGREHEHDCLWRAVVGARRGGCSGCGRSAAGRCDGAAGRAAGRARIRRGNAGSRDPLS